jgi:hypothetical protein
MIAESSSKAEFRNLVHLTAKMLAGRAYQREQPADIKQGEYVQARWPEFTSMALDFLALKAAELEAREKKRGVHAPPRFTL